ncbi:MAG: glycosyltransferase family 2 protein [Mediterranea sp.]|jgi:hypothetical protein|nr:glycosyltransferase family 2 protein [Mediterranea sp.]
MKHLHIITPVKDAIELTLETARAVMASQINIPFTYVIYNDFSTEANTQALQQASAELGFELVNLADLTTHPSPNYLLILQQAQQRANAEGTGVLIVESDVVIKPHIVQGLIDGAMQHPDCGIAAAVTVNEHGHINYPYLYAVDRPDEVFATQRHCSFCCSLLTPALLQRFDFGTLDPNKSWYDVTISHQSLKEGFQNYLFTTLPVWHRPHSSRPWKKLKYTNPLKYYWLKYTKGLDKI